MLLQWLFIEKCNIGQQWKHIYVGHNSHVILVQSIDSFWGDLCRKENFFGFHVDIYLHSQTGLPDDCVGDWELRLLTCLLRPGLHGQVNLILCASKAAPFQTQSASALSQITYQNQAVRLIVGSFRILSHFAYLSRSNFLSSCQIWSRLIEAKIWKQNLVVSEIYLLLPSVLWGKLIAR